MTTEVAQSIQEIERAFPDATVSADEDGNGGAYVTVSNVSLSPVYKQSETWIGFHVTYQYPYADVYPHFVREDLRRVDGKPLGDDDPKRRGVSSGQFGERPATQLSRSSNRLTPGTDTALLKLWRVLRWLNDRP